MIKIIVPCIRIYKKVKQKGCDLHNIISFGIVPIITRRVRNV